MSRLIIKRTSLLITGLRMYGENIPKYLKGRPCSPLIMHIYVIRTRIFRFNLQDSSELHSDVFVRIPMWKTDHK